MQVFLIFSSMVFCIISAVKPFKIKKTPINIASAPIIVLIFLFALRVIDVNIIKNGIMGKGGLSPLEIIIIFYTTAYISISVDVTGIFDYFAYRIIKKSKGNGIMLFVFFYLFSCILTVFTSNDIVILTLTPIILYLNKHAKINVIPLLFAEFFGANTLSMFLYIGNPTNIILGNALNIEFLNYTSTMWLPSIGACILNLVLLYIVFRKDLTLKFQMNYDSTFTVRNWFDAIVSYYLLFSMLVFLIVSHKIHPPIWLITTFFASAFLVLDLVFAFYYHIRHRFMKSNQIEKYKMEILDVYGIKEHNEDCWISFHRMPWKILPFIITFFILINALNEYGIISIIAGILSKYSTGLLSGILINGIFGFILSNIINNQPMSIFYANILNNSHFIVSGKTLNGALYSVIIASNLGANLTLLGALAGLMWSRILKTKGLEIDYKSFLKIGIAITPAVFIVTLLILYFVLI